VSKIYISGDTHGDVRRFSTSNWKEGKTLTKNDYVIILGDFGMLWCSHIDDPHYKEEVYWLDWLENKPWITLFVEGNHSNFDRLDNLPEVEMFNGTVGKVSDSIFHLKRGEIYTIADKKLLSFGGAMSIDKHRRIENVSWWARESPNKAEEDYGIDNLIKHDMKVDFIFTHTCPQSIVSLLLGPDTGTMDRDKANERHKFFDPLTKYLEYIRNSIQFKRWFFGHFHRDEQIDDKFVVVWNRIHRLI